MSITEIAIQNLFEQKRIKEKELFEQKRLKEKKLKAHIKIEAHFKICSYELHKIFEIEDQIYGEPIIIPDTGDYTTKYLIYTEKHGDTVELDYTIPISPEKELELYNMFQKVHAHKKKFVTEIRNTPNSIEYILTKD